VSATSPPVPVVHERGLERLLRPSSRATLDTAAGTGRPEWLRAGPWRVLARPRRGAPTGETIQRFELASGAPVAAVHDAESDVWIPFDLDEAYAAYVTEAWRESQPVRALSSRQLDAYYRIKRVVPRSWLLSARRLLMRWTGLPAFPAWPLDESVDRLARFYAQCLLVAADEGEATFRWFWPRRHRAAVVLTHDVESAEGLRLAVEIADLEEMHGFRSSFNIVGGDYPIDDEIVRELRARGFEIGLHGLHHDRSLFASRASFEAQLPRLAEAAGRLEALGFRSPSTHRVIEWLPELPVSYDCSVPHSDPYEPQPGGCCSLWPYFLGSVVELPYTLPQDHTLFTLLRSKSVDLWLSQVGAIERRFGLVQCLSHPDPGYLGDPDKRALYGEFLAALGARDALWRPLPRELAAWWSRRDAGDGSDPDLSLGRMRRGDGGRASLHPPA